MLNMKLQFISFQGNYEIMKPRHYSSRYQFIREKCNVLCFMCSYLQQLSLVFDLQSSPFWRRYWVFKVPLNNHIP